MRLNQWRPVLSATCKQGRIAELPDRGMTTFFWGCTRQKWPCVRPCFLPHDFIDHRTHTMGDRPTVPAEVARQVFTACGHACAVCATPIPLELAHIVPWCESREHQADNLVCLCPNCHARSDYEKWSQKTLREYRLRPMAVRQRELAQRAPEPTTRIITTIKMQIASFDETQSRLLKYALAEFLGISPEEVRIKFIDEGSVKLTVELPTRSAERLLDAYKAKDPLLQEYIVRLGINEVYLAPSGFTPIAGIHVFAPGRLLTIPFLAQQVWLRARRNRLLVTEVYDFLLQVDDDRPLDSFSVASPHFCRKCTEDGTWTDSIHLLPVGDGASTNWGWFYYGNHVRDGDQLMLQVPNCTEQGGRDALLLKGFDLVEKRIVWEERLRDENSIDLMRQIKKSFYRVTFDRPLLPHGENRIWFRLLVEPAELDVRAPIRGVDQSFVDWLFPSWKLDNSVSCPWHVRRAVSERLDTFRHLHPHKGPQIDMLRQAIATEGFGMPGTSTRIVEHRIMLGGDGVAVDVQRSSPALTYLGALPGEFVLPPFGHDYAADPTPTGKKIVAVVHCAAAGSVENCENDLVSVICRCFDEARVSPKTKMQLAQAMTPSAFREGCFLIDKLVEHGLLTMEANSVCRASTLAPETVAERLAELRRQYLEPENSSAFPEARGAFDDLHPFRFDFSCVWQTGYCGRRIALNTIAFCAVTGFIVGVTLLLLQLFGW